MAAQQHSSPSDAHEIIRQADLSEMFDAGLGTLLASVGHVARLAPDPDETVPAQRTVNRAFLLLLRLWHGASPGILDVLHHDTFVTRTGDGVLQLEWQRPGLYLEVEVRAHGPLGVLIERCGTGEDAEYEELALSEDELQTLFVDLFESTLTRGR